MKPSWLLLIAVLVAFVGVVAARSVVFVDETETVLITQFGRPVRTLETAGPYIKAPYQSALRIDRRLQIYDPPPSEFLAAEKKNLDLDVFVCWRVADASRFLKTVNGFPGANSHIHDVVFSELRAEVGQSPLETLVCAEPSGYRVDRLAGALAALTRSRPEDVAIGKVALESGRNLLQSLVGTAESPHRLDAMMDGVTQRCSDRVRAAYGIEIVDVRLKRISLPAQVRDSVFGRMRAERAKIAQRYRGEGEAEAMKIRAAAKKLETITLAKAESEATMIAGRAEAEATRIYANAHRRDPAFYELLRKLEAYEKFLDEKTTILMSADSDLLKYLFDDTIPELEPAPE